MAQPNLKFGKIGPAQRRRRRGRPDPLQIELLREACALRLVARELQGDSRAGPLRALADLVERVLQ